MEWVNADNTSTVTTNLSEYLVNTTVSTYLVREKCLDWKDSQHVLYQLANLGFAVAFLVPGTFSSHGPLLRGLVCCGCIFVVLWGGTITCRVDIIAWHVVFLVINTAHLLYAIYDAYPVQFSSDLELTYHKLFLPLDVPRSIFKQLADLGQIWHLEEGAIFAKQGATYSGEQLSVLLTGHLQVLHQGLWLHNIEAGSLVNSIEYESIHESQTGSYQVSYHAVEDCTLLTWQKDELFCHLDVSPEHKALFHVLLGRDIHQKLTLVQEGLMRDPRYLQFVKERRRKLFYCKDTLGRGFEGRSTSGEVIVQNGSTTALGSSSQLVHGDVSCSNLTPRRSCNTSIALELSPPSDNGVYVGNLDQSQQLKQTSIETSL